MQNLRIMEWSFPESVKHCESILELKNNLKNWEMLTALLFYVDEFINKDLIAFCWFLLAFAICKHQRKIKL